MRTTRRRLRTSARHLERTMSGLLWEGVTDWRAPRGRRYSVAVLLNALTLGMLLCSRTLRDVEELLDSLPANTRRRLSCPGAPSDTTLYRASIAVDPDELGEELVRQVRAMWRNRQLEPGPTLPIHLVSVDGKAIAKNAEDSHPEVQKRRNGKGGPQSFCLMALRAVHVSSAVKPALAQAIIPAGTGESRWVTDFIWGLCQVYSRLVECVFIDAGLSSAKNRWALAVNRIHYIGGLKGNHASVYGLARQLLGGDGPPPNGWSCVHQEKRNGGCMTRSFARVSSNGFKDGDNYRQFWRVKQELVRKDGTAVEAERYFVTSLPQDRLTDDQCLAAVRAHWGIENDCNWTLDTQWLEDTRAWAWKGKALESLAVLRLIAYNAVRLLKRRKFKSKTGRAIPYRSLFRLMRDSLLLPHPVDPPLD